MKNCEIYEKFHKFFKNFMKKFLIILTFLFVSIFTYSDSAFSYSKSVNIDFDVRVMMGLTKIEENDNPRYKKFFNYIDESLAKKGEVKYSHKLNTDKKVVEFFSEKGELLLTENLPKEFLDRPVNVLFPFDASVPVLRQTGEIPVLILIVEFGQIVLQSRLDLPIFPIGENTVIFSVG